jgi:ATP-dependent DNA ligase
VHEIKHDGYRLMARRDPVSVSNRLLTRNGHDYGRLRASTAYAMAYVRKRTSCVCPVQVSCW